MGKFSRRQTDEILSQFSLKISFDISFSYLRKQFARNGKAYFLGKMRKINKKYIRKVFQYVVQDWTSCRVWAGFYALSVALGWAAASSAMAAGAGCTGGVVGLGA